jgi:tRNA G18 (ribose-2'-O)-methylase SpoU
MLFWLKEFVCAAIQAQPPRKEIQKTALGATETVDWMHFSAAVEAVQQLKQRDYKVFAIEQTEGSISLEKFYEAEEKIAVVFGNEVEGVTNDVLKICDGSIEIPQFGMKHSLNISVAAGIVLYKLSEPRLERLKAL